jgi:hypothetical protein
VDHPAPGTGEGMILTLAIIAGVLIVAFIALGLVWAFAADRRRSQEVANDSDRLDADNGPGPTDHTAAEAAERDRLHTDHRFRP